MITQMNITKENGSVIMRMETPKSQHRRLAFENSGMYGAERLARHTRTEKEAIKDVLRMYGAFNF